MKAPGAGPRVAALDAVRGLAIGFVILRHGFPSVFGAGNFVGVEIFFVLSGFLITGILVRDHERGRMSYRRFYRNRFVRLLPALLLMVFGVTAVALIWPSAEREATTSGVLTALTYTADLPFAVFGPQMNELTHMWTLAIEEQFYLVWPAIIGFLVARRGVGSWVTRLTWLAAVVLAITFAQGLARNDLVAIYTWPMTWAVTLLVGACLAVGTLRVPSQPKAASAAFVGLVVLAFVPGAKDHVWGYVMVLPLVALLSAVLIANAASDHPAAFLKSRWLQRLGTVSYAAYLWNYPVSTWVAPIPSIVLTLILATASWWGVERWALRLKAHAPDRKPVDPERPTSSPRVSGNERASG